MAYFTFRLPWILCLWGKYRWRRYALFNAKPRVRYLDSFYDVEHNPRIEKFADLIRLHCPEAQFECEELVSSELPEAFHNTEARIFWIECQGQSFAVNPNRLPDIRPAE